jgi:hypothetical protein
VVNCDVVHILDYLKGKLQFSFLCHLDKVCKMEEISVYWFLTLMRLFIRGQVKASAAIENSICAKNLLNCTLVYFVLVMFAQSLKAIYCLYSSLCYIKK